MPSNLSPVHPSALVVAAFGLITATLLGIRNSSWEAGLGFGLFALLGAVIVNSILRKRHQEDSQSNS